MTMPHVTGMTPVVGPQPRYQVSDSETYSKNILGPIYFELSNLRVAGTAGEPTPPGFVAPSQSPYIIASNEPFSVSVDIKFNKSPLSELLLCLGTELKINFAFEGIGGTAAELDLPAMEVTTKGEFNYIVTFSGVPNQVGLTPGFYAIAAVATIGPAKHPCSQYIFGYGYIAKALLQVY
jgi:hypothetical protein